MSHRHILLSIDSASETRQDVLIAHAQRIAAQSGAHLSHVHVQLPHGRCGMAGAIASLVESESDAASVMGRPAIVANQVADDIAADLVMMSNHMPELFFLNRTEDKATLRHAKHDVLFVKGDDVEYRKVLCVIDLNQANHPYLLTQAKMFAEQTNAQLTVMSVFTDGTWAETKYLGPFELPVIGTDDFAGVREKLRYLAAQYGLGKERVVLREGEFQTALAEEFTQNSYDLLVIGNQERHGWHKLAPSTAAQVLENVECDILAIYLPQSNDSKRLDYH